eukprot:TRINITY_DN2632_c0_g1_i2.p1 TRINITY_DN2632_c0_g1~~TRINITY_DN2632_c0_g1_i2.p1  ORF type:complete len:384 (+),score=65.78 TRINITY_DN2632_c0_g1_i2:265-1416(+)
MKCPITGGPLALRELNDVPPIVSELILKCQVRCPYLDLLGKQCSWQGTWESFKNEHESSCETKNSKCPFFECTFRGTATNVNKHLKSCPYRDVKCTLCHSIIAIQTFEEHSKQCKDSSVPCLRCHKKIKRTSLSKHQEDGCNERCRICPYRQFGCEIQLDNFEIRTHTSDEIKYHTELVIDRAERLYQDVADAKLDQMNVNKALGETDARLATCFATLEQLVASINVVQQDYAQIKNGFQLYLNAPTPKIDDSQPRMVTEYDLLAIETQQLQQMVGIVFGQIGQLEMAFGKIEQLQKVFEGDIKSMDKNTNLLDMGRVILDKKVKMIVQSIAETEAKEKESKRPKAPETAPDSAKFTRPKRSVVGSGHRTGTSTPRKWSIENQ